MERVQLATDDFEGFNNVYVLQSGDGVTLIDAGINTEAMYDQLQKRLAAVGATVGDVDRVFLTHWHRDHTGLADDVQAESGAVVYIHEDDAPLVRDPPWRQMEPRYTRLFDEWGVPPAKRARVKERFDAEDEVRRAASLDVETFQEGRAFDAGGRTLEVIHAPGHTAGQSCFAFDGERGREVFSGDALLPEYTPNVGGADVRLERPLSRYLDTLVDLVERDFARAWPGHRDPMDDPAGRAVEIVGHHRERARRALDALGSEPTDAWTVSERLFGDLDDIHILHGPAEADAHLDYLARHGVVERAAAGYVRDGEERDVEAAFPQLPRRGSGTNE